MENFTEIGFVANLPHQIQRKMELHIDTADGTLYVKTPSLRNNRWTPVAILNVIKVSAKRHEWRVQLTEELKKFGTDDDE